jgi:hypothetical protein
MSSTVTACEIEMCKEHSAFNGFVVCNFCVICTKCMLEREVASVHPFINYWTDLYSAFTDKVERNCHLPNSGRNFCKNVS